jgi:26S proteasome non-ATPase regulatory subunit 9
MDDIHAPTVASGPASGALPRDLSKLSMPELMQEKERIEEELSALSAVLQSVRSPIQIDSFYCCF